MAFIMVVNSVGCELYLEVRSEVGVLQRRKEYLRRDMYKKAA